MAPELLEIISRTAVEFVVIDGEHAPLTVTDIARAAGFLQLAGVSVLVRVGDHGYADAQRLLDAGLAGVLVPHVSSRAEAEAVADQLLFPPLGTRGMGFNSRAGGWGALPGGVAEYLRYGNESIARVIMIETPEAVADRKRILETPGVTAVFVGPGDLSVCLGVAITDPRVQALVADVQASAQAAGVPCGTVASTPEQYSALSDAGFDFVLLGSDLGFITQGLMKALAG